MDDSVDTVLKPFPVTYFCRKWFPTSFKHIGALWDRRATARFKINQTLAMKLELRHDGAGIFASVLGQAGVVETIDLMFSDYYSQGLATPARIRRTLETIHDDPERRLDPCESRDFQISYGSEGMFRNKIQSLAWEYEFDGSKLKEVHAGFEAGKDEMERAIIDIIDVWA